jgi:GH24 family phage-related lysozyme (muramidase)
LRAFTGPAGAASVDRAIADINQKLPAGYLAQFLTDHAFKPANNSPDAIKDAFQQFLGALPHIPPADVGLTIETFEGLDQASQWPGGGSGITIGIGYDIGETNAQKFRNDWAGVIPDAWINELVSACGVLGQAAKAIAHRFTNIHVNSEEAHQVFNQHTLPDVRRETNAIYPLDGLDADTQSALMSLVYNRGAGLQGDSRREMKAIQGLVPEQDYLGIAAQLLSMRRLWPHGLDGLLKRRAAEADMCIMSYCRSLAGAADESPSIDRAPGDDGDTTPSADGSTDVPDAPVDATPSDNSNAVTPIGLAAAGASEADKYAFYSQLITQAGAEVNPQRDDGTFAPSVLGIRGIDFGSRKTHPTDVRPLYNDTIIALTKDAAGNPHVLELSGATHPGQTRSTQSPDVDHDGVGDPAMIKPGTYQCRPHGMHANAPSFQLFSLDGSDQIPCWRNTKHTMFYTQQEIADSDQRGDTATAILIHQGNSGPSGVSSIGCQTMPPVNLQAFLKRVGVQSTFDYTLVDASLPNAS